MHLSEIGKIVNQEWLKSFELRIDMNLGMGEFVVMPNHFHAIIFIGENDYNRTGICRDAMPCVSTVATHDGDLDCCSDKISGGGNATPDCGNATYDSGNAMIGRGDAMIGIGDAKHCVSTCFGPQSKNLASIVRGFKIGVTKRARLIRSDFNWQSRYHDHIIRNDAEYHRITNYIIANPSNWDVDKFNL
jgi:REP element-mobilizing transposase RayT